MTRSCAVVVRGTAMNEPNSQKLVLPFVKNVTMQVMWQTKQARTIACAANQIINTICLYIYRAAATYLKERKLYTCQN